MPTSTQKQRAAKRKEQQSNQRIILFVILLAVAALAAIFYRPKQAGFKIDEANMIETASGLKYKDLVIGNGPEAQTGDLVSVHYTGYLTNGTKFDSSIDRGQPFSFQLGTGSVIRGWEEGIAGMRVGGKRQLLIPPELGYGSRGAGDVIPPNAVLFFEVELLEVTSER